SAGRSIRPRPASCWWRDGAPSNLVVAFEPIAHDRRMLRQYRIHSLLVVVASLATACFKPSLPGDDDIGTDDDAEGDGDGDGDGEDEGGYQELHLTANKDVDILFV